MSAFVSDDELVARIADAAKQIEALRAGMAGPLRDLHDRDSHRLNGALAAAQRVGYRLSQLADILGLTGQAVHWRIKNGDPDRRPYALLSDAEAAELHRAHAAADGRNPAKRECVYAYRQLLRRHVEAGASQSYLARLLDLTPAAIGHQVRRARASMTAENTVDAWKRGCGS